MLMLVVAKQLKARLFLNMRSCPLKRNGRLRCNTSTRIGVFVTRRKALVIHMSD